MIFLVVKRNRSLKNPTRALRVSLWIQRSKFAKILKLQNYLNFAEE
jgi:hypothetical protein